jgi:hypothetical protein
MKKKIGAALSLAEKKLVHETKNYGKNIGA